MRGHGSLPLKRSAFAALLLPFITDPSRAASIELRLTLDCSAEQIAAECRAAIENIGTEPAFELKLHFALRGQETDTAPRSRLDPGARFQETLLLAPETVSSGEHAATLLVAYADASGTPLSAVTSVLVRPEGEPASAPLLAATIAESSFTAPARLVVELENLGSRPTAVVARWHLPRELEATPRTRTLTLQPAGKAVATFEVSGAAASPGSSYGAFAIVEGESGTTRSTVLIPARVSIAPRPVLRWPRRVAVVGLIAVFFAIVAAELRARSTPALARAH